MPIDVLRLISELLRAGRSDVAQPRCADCGRDRFLRAHRPDGQRVCASCSQAYHLPERCGRCGQQARVCARDPAAARSANSAGAPTPRRGSPAGSAAVTPGPGHDQRHPDRRLLLPAPARTLLGLRDRPRRQPLQNPESHLRRLRRRPARSVQLLRPGRQGAPTGRGAVVPALRLGCDPPVRWLPGTDRQPRRRRGAPLPGLLLPAPASLRAVRAGPRHRPASGWRRPGTVRELLDRPGDPAREVRPAAPVPR